VDSDNSTEILGVLGVQNETSLQDFRKKLLAFEKKKHYNNRLIVELLSHREFKELFSFFLQNKARDWLNNSAVVDKKAHGDVLGTYIEASLDEGNLEKIVCLKPRASKQWVKK